MARENRAVQSIPGPSALKGSSSAVSHIPELDGLRGTAILLVLLVHFYLADAVHQYLASTSLSKLWGFAILGLLGVDLFFVLSGFLITSILLNTKELPHYFRSFYGRRAVRIFPLYFICLLLYYHGHFPFFGPGMDGPHDTTQELWYWTYLANWKISSWSIEGLSHFWSLCVEEQFYLIWPFVVWTSTKRTFPWVCLAVIGGSLGAGVAFEFAGFSERFVSFASVPRMEAIVLGSLLAWLVRQSWLSRITDHLKLILPTAFLLLGVCALDPPYFRSYYTLKFLIAGVCWSALLLHCVTRSDGYMAALMRSRLLSSFGKYSYAIYVLHPMVFAYVGRYTLQVLQPYALPSPLLVVALFASISTASFLAGLLSWHLLEKHFLRLKKYFPYQVGGALSSEHEAKTLAETVSAD